MSYELIHLRQGANAILRTPTSKVLLLRAVSKLAPGWTMPGGLYDPYLDTDVRAACAREINEETGITLEPSAYTELWSSMLRQPIRKLGHTALFREYYFYTTCHEQPVTLSREHDAYAWFPLDVARDVVAHPAARVALDYSLCPPADTSAEVIAVR